MVGSTVGGSLGLDSSVFIWLSVSTLSFPLLLGSAASGFSISPCSESVFTMVSLCCRSGDLAFSLSVVEVGASRTIIY